MHRVEIKWKPCGKYTLKISMVLKNTTTGASASTSTSVNVVRLTDTIDELDLLSSFIERNGVLRRSFLPSLMLAIQYFVIQTSKGDEQLEYRSDLWGWAQVETKVSR